jgi:hypothetical protein
MTASSSDSMTLDHTITYVAYLNWGVFDSANSTNTTYTWGSKNEDDTQLFNILEPTSSTYLKMYPAFGGAIALILFNICIF